MTIPKHADVLQVMEWYQGFRSITAAMRNSETGKAEGLELRI
jgi:hypothetical protein